MMALIGGGVKSSGETHDDEELPEEVIPWVGEDYTPTDEQIEFNYTKVEIVDGYGCEFDFNTNTTEPTVLYLRREDIGEDLTGCEPAKWKQRSVNCDRKNTTFNLCKEGRVNKDLATLKLDGTQSCVDASNAINMKYEGVTDELLEECGDDSGRRRRLRLGYR